MINYDGHDYASYAQVPDLGSLVCTGVDGGRRDYEGHYSDRTKLPKYADLETGSSALLSNNGSLVLFKYYADTQTWESKGEVI